MNFYPKRRRMPQVMIVSLIDIFAILLIFVIVSTQFRKEQPAVSIRLPESKRATTAQPKREPIVLTISKESQLFWDNNPVEIERLSPLLKQLVLQDPATFFALNADRDAPFGMVMRVLNSLKDAGVKGNLTAFMERPK